MMEARTKSFEVEGLVDDVEVGIVQRESKGGLGNQHTFSVTKKTINSYVSLVVLDEGPVQASGLTATSDGAAASLKD